MNKLTPQELFSAHHPAWLEAWRTARVGIAGAGGLGSNAAISLARAGVGTLIIVDFDVVSPSNLNRQQYRVDQIGMPKVYALRDNILACAPFTNVSIHQTKVTPDNITQLFGNVDILIEAFDVAEHKQMLAEAWLDEYPEKPLIMASGLSGVGANHMIETISEDNLYIIGDGISEPQNGISPVSARVAVVANLQANLCLELLCKSAGIDTDLYWKE